MTAFKWTFARSYGARHQGMSKAFTGKYDDVKKHAGAITIAFVESAGRNAAPTPKGEGPWQHLD